MHNVREIQGCPKPVGPYSAAVVHNGIAYCSGQIGLDPETGKIVSGGIAAETERVLKNIEALLRGVGSSKEKILLTTIFVTDLSNWKTVNELYGKYVGNNAPPARQTVGVKELPLGALIEITVLAAVS